MKLFAAIVLLAAASTAARLDNTYLPPKSAATAGGQSNFLSTPLQGSTTGDNNQAAGTNGNGNGHHVTVINSNGNGHHAAASNGNGYHTAITNGNGNGYHAAATSGNRNGQHTATSNGNGHYAAASNGKGIGYLAPATNGNGNGYTATSNDGGNGYRGSATNNNGNGYHTAATTNGNGYSSSNGNGNGHHAASSNGNGNGHHAATSDGHGYHAAGNGNGYHAASNSNENGYQASATNGKSYQGVATATQVQHQSGQYSEANSNGAGSEIGIVKFINENNGDGSYRFVYEAENKNFHQEEGHLKDPETIDVQGSYSYISPEGQQITVTYIANENGFQPTGEHIPTSPPIPEEILRSLEKNAADEAAGISDDGQYHGEGSGAARPTGTAGVIAASNTYETSSLNNGGEGGYRY